MSKKCNRCGKKWCGTNKKLKKLYPDELWAKTDRTYGSRECRDRAAARRKTT